MAKSFFNKKGYFFIYKRLRSLDEKDTLTHNKHLSSLRERERQIEFSSPMLLWRCSEVSGSVVLSWEENVDNILHHPR